MLSNKSERVFALAILLFSMGCRPSGTTPPEAALACETAEPLNPPALPTNLPLVPKAASIGAANLFQHGVASGDPNESDVIVWTRVTPGAGDPVTVPVFFEVALDDKFAERVAAGEVTTDASTDFTVKIDVIGLKWGRDYHYRFQALGRTSPVGHTRLAPPQEKAACARFAVVSCSSYVHGYFYAYQHIADREDIDAVLHLGDYIYEYKNGDYGDVRTNEPGGELITLADYRGRYADYRRDPALQAIHRAHPIYNTWDDHETTDNAYTNGCTGDSKMCDGYATAHEDWEARKAAARQAYFEWIPIRETMGRRVWRSFSYGALANLVFLDTRIAGRDEQIEDPSEDTPERHLLDDAQEDWLRSELKASDAAWEIVAQQVIVSHLRLGKAPTSMDAWDGYSGSQGRLLDMFEAEDENVVVLTGDVHSSWALELARDPFAPAYSPEADNLGVEFVVPGISSPGGTEAYHRVFAPLYEEENPHLVWTNLYQRGYMVLDVTPEKVQADWFLLDGVDKGQGHQSFASGWFAKRGDARLFESKTPSGRVTGAETGP